MRNVILLCGLLIFAAFVFYSLTNQRHPVAFEVPQGYVGWIRVRYNIAGAAPLPLKGGHYIARIPSNGLLKTSTVEEEGGAADRFYYFNQANQKMAIDGFKTNVALIWGDAGRTNERFMFIGTEQQFADAQRLIRGSDPGPLTLPITSESEQNSKTKLNLNSVPSPFQLPPVTQYKPKKP